MTTTCTHDCGCTREAEPTKADCYRCWSASKRGVDCQPTTEQRILALLADAVTTGVVWLRAPSIASALRLDDDSAILAGTLARMAASGAIVATPALWMGATEMRYSLHAPKPTTSTPLRVRTPMDTILGKATLEAKVGVDRAGDIIAGSTR